MIGFSDPPPRCRRGGEDGVPGQGRTFADRVKRASWASPDRVQRTSGMTGQLLHDNGHLLKRNG